MAEFGLKLGSFRHNPRGVREVWKSEAMQAALRELTDSKTSEANALARTHFHHGVSDADEPYRGKVVVLANTAIGQVEPNARIGWVDQAMRHTLDEINH